jgi:hypothetical protein
VVTVNLPTTRKEAKQIGAEHYFTGLVCKHGHTVKRITKSGACISCLVEVKALQSKQSEERKRVKGRQYTTEAVKKKTYPKGTWSKQYARYKADPYKMLKLKAKATVKREIYKGNLKRQPCEVCQATKFIHAHHEDYSKPMEVKWLCPQHHQDRHKELKAQGINV